MKKIWSNKNAKATSFYLFGNIFDKAIAFITIPIFTRMLSTTDYGIVNTYLSWVMIFSVIVGLSLGSTIRNAYIDYKENLQEYISSIMFLSLINFIITSLSIMFIVYLYIDNVDMLLVIFCLVHSFMIYIINTVSMEYMVSMNYIRRTLLLALPNIFITIFSIILLFSMETDGYWLRIFSYLLVTLIIGTILLFIHFIKGKVFINLKYWQYALSLSIPLVFHGLSVNILTASDRTMLLAFTNASETGIYSLVYSFSMIALVVTSSLGSVWIPWFNKKMVEDRKDIINKAVNIYIEIIVIMMISILFIGPEILIILAPVEYWSGKVLIPPILLASFFIFLYSISVDLEYYYKSTKIIAMNTMVAAVINLILNLILIPPYGALGAAIATVIAYIISFVIHYSAAKKLDNKLFPISTYILPILVMFSSSLIYYLLLDFPIIRWFLAIIINIAYLFAVVKLNKLAFIRVKDI